METLYRNSDVREKCRKVFESDFSDGTWRNWKRLMRVPLGEWWLTGEQVADLLTVALLRREQPRRRLNFLIVRRERRDRDWSEWVAVLAQCRDKTLIHPCTGLELPDLLYRATGRKVAEATLYEWGRSPGVPEYSRNAKYSSEQVGQWILRAQRSQSKASDKKNNKQTKKVKHERAVATAA